jgi:anti-anti-sigma regulatory factor
VTLAVHCHLDGATADLTLRGDLDYAGAPVLRDAVTSVLRPDRLPARLVVDLTDARVLGPIVGGPLPDPAAPVTT